MIHWAKSVRKCRTWKTEHPWYICCKWIQNETYPTCIPYIEAVSQRCSVKKVFLEISQNSKENTCARVSFLIKLQVSACSSIKKETLEQVFSCEICEIFKNTSFPTEHLRWLLLDTYSWINVIMSVLYFKCFLKQKTLYDWRELKNISVIEYHSDNPRLLV